MTRKLEQIIDLPIASAPFLASIWRDFRELRGLLEREHGKQDLMPPPAARHPRVRPLIDKEKGQAEAAALEV
ncbi:MAG TPA: hypothetical protein VGO22_04910 [Pseudorhizobium sp.]|nr:hypothetical protein [Pseudorhizobium sp.]